MQNRKRDVSFLRFMMDGIKGLLFKVMPEEKNK